MTNTTLEDRGFVATEKDVANIAHTILRAENQFESGRCSYLRVLIATTQHELTADSEPLQTLHLVNKRFYSAVVKVNDKAIPKDFPDRAGELNRVTNYARTAAYAIRTWMKAGNDIRQLDARVATKALLVVPRIHTADSELLKARVERQITTLQEALEALAAASPETAVEELRQVMAAFSERLSALESDEDASGSERIPEEAAASTA